MHVKKAAICGFIVLCAGVAFAAQDSAMRRAFLDHERHEDQRIKPYTENIVMEERWKNYQKNVASCPQIGEVVRIEVSKTRDGGQYVIRMFGVDYHASNGPRDNRGFDSGVCSFWLDDTSVEGITPY